MYFYLRIEEGFIAALKEGPDGGGTSKSNL
jgi:hypothetical protein